MVKYIIYNPFSGSEQYKKLIERISAENDNTKIISIDDMNGYEAFFGGLAPDDEVMICGGDGTVNHFINETNGIEIKNKVYYIPVGTGNDFARDIGFSGGEGEMICMDKYIKHLPKVSVKGKEYRFINNVGFGIDGYCCEEGDKIRENNEKNGTKKRINYTTIAIKGLLRYFKPRNAVVSVDGKEYSFKKVWLAAAMNGRYYGGGMMAAPKQNRLDEKKISLVVFHRVQKFHALMIFPTLFKGTHVKYTKYITILEGSDIRVSFDRPTPLQIDGETIRDVLSYTASK